MTITSIFEAAITGAALTAIIVGCGFIAGVAIAALPPAKRAPRAKKGRR